MTLTRKEAKADSTRCPSLPRLASGTSSEIRVPSPVPAALTPPLLALEHRDNGTELSKLGCSDFRGVESRSSHRFCGLLDQLTKGTVRSGHHVRGVSDGQERSPQGWGGWVGRRDAWRGGLCAGPALAAPRAFMRLPRRLRLWSALPLQTLLELLIPESEEGTLLYPHPSPLLPTHHSTPLQHPGAAPSPWRGRLWTPQEASSLQGAAEGRAWPPPSRLIRQWIPPLSHLLLPPARSLGMSPHYHLTPPRDSSTP